MGTPSVQSASATGFVEPPGLGRRRCTASGSIWSESVPRGHQGWSESMTMGASHEETDKIARTTGRRRSCRRPSQRQIGATSSARTYTAPPPSCCWWSVGRCHASRPSPLLSRSLTLRRRRLVRRRFLPPAPLFSSPRRYPAFLASTRLRGYNPALKEPSATLTGTTTTGSLASERRTSGLDSSAGPG